MTMTPDEALRDLCREKCAAFGDPPCYEIDERASRLSGEPVIKFEACEECAIELGIAEPDALDPGAVVSPLL